MSKEINKCYHVLMVCHGNICRSPMAEFYMKDLVKRHGVEARFHIESAATSTEEIGNPVHHGTKQKLSEVGISCGGKTARQMTREDYSKFDYLIGMDSRNIKNMIRIVGGDPEQKIHKMLEFAGSSGDVADPWYTGDFEATWRDVSEGCKGLLETIRENHDL